MASPVGENAFCSNSWRRLESTSILASCFFPSAGNNDVDRNIYVLGYDNNKNLITIIVNVMTTIDNDANNN